MSPLFGLTTAARRRAHRRGLTLVEVMIAGAIMVMLLLALLGTILQAYRMNEESRRRDQARAILQSFANDFACNNIWQGVGVPNPLFAITTTPTGTGMSWTSANGTTTDGTTDGLIIRLGGDPQAPQIVVRRHVRNVNETMAQGSPDNDASIKSSVGRELVAEFSAVYTVNSRAKTITLTILRADT